MLRQIRSREAWNDETKVVAARPYFVAIDCESLVAGVLGRIDYGWSRLPILRALHLDPRSWPLDTSQQSVVLVEEQSTGMFDWICSVLPCIAVGSSRLVVVLLLVRFTTTQRHSSTAIGSDPMLIHRNVQLALLRTVVN